MTQQISTTAATATIGVRPSAEIVGTSWALWLELLGLGRLVRGSGEDTAGDLQIPMVASPTDLDSERYLAVEQGTLTTSELQIFAESATDVKSSQQILQANLLAYLRSAFVNATDEVFEDGNESAFSRALIAVIHTYGQMAIRALEQIMQYEQINIEVMAEAVQQFGSIVDRNSHESRLTILVTYLRSSDARLRDAASIGLSDMDDPNAIQAVLDAIMVESSHSLRRNLQLVLNQLEETQQCNNS